MAAVVVDRVAHFLAAHYLPDKAVAVVAVVVRVVLLKQHIRL